MKNLFIYKLLIVFFMMLTGIYFYPQLPDIIPTHWWINGKPDAMGSKLFSLIMIPSIVLVMVILFPILSKMDPKKENYEKFANIWEIFQFAIIWFFAYIYFVIIYASLHPEINISPFMISWIWILFIILGNYMGKIRQNYFVGIKLPWTLENEEVWNKTHRLSGKIFLIWWLFLLIDSYLLFYPFALLVTILVFILIIPIWYSYYIFKNIKKS